MSNWRNIPITLKIPLQIAEGANRRRKLVLTPVNVNYPAAALKSLEASCRMRCAELEFAR